MSLRKFIARLLISAVVFFQTISAFADAPVGDIGEVQKMLSSMMKQMDDMKKTIDRQNAKIQYLEEKTRDGVQTGQPISGTQVAAPMSEKDFQDMLKSEIKNVSYFKNLKMGGDFRLRWEGVNYSETDSSSSTADNGNADNNRFRYRLRYGIENSMDDFKVGFRIASAVLNNTSANGGTVYGGDPTSTNQTLGSPGLFSFKTIAVDKAYASYTPKLLNDYQLGPISVKKFEIGGGKFDNPHAKYSSPMVWDGDVTPEGAYEKIDLNLYSNEGNEVNLFGLAMQAPLQQSAAGDNDATLYSFGTGLNVTAYTPLTAQPIEFTSAYSIYQYQNFADNAATTVGGTSLIKSNTGCVGTAGAGPCTGLESGDPRIFQIYNELGITPIGDVPLKAFMDIATNVNNGSVSGESAMKDTAWGFGGKVGKLKSPKDWELSYGYYVVPPNAVVGAFSDSDFGHNNRIGSVVKAGYQLTKSLQLNLAWFNVGNYDQNLVTTGDQKTNLFQTDLVWKF